MFSDRWRKKTISDVAAADLNLKEVLLNGNVFANIPKETVELYPVRR